MKTAHLRRFYYQKVFFYVMILFNMIVAKIISCTNIDAIATDTQKVFSFLFSRYFISKSLRVSYFL